MNYSLVKFNDDFSPKGKMVNGKWYAGVPSPDLNLSQRVQMFFDIMRERHAIYLRRQQGLPKPWTNDPILSSYRFCNTYRELDTVSQWFIHNVIKPYEDHPDLWFFLCAARIINWPDSIQDMLNAPGALPIKGRYDPETAYKVLRGRKDSGQKFITGAYIVNSVTTAKDPDHIRGDKAAFIAYRTLGEIWPDRAKIRPMFKESLHSAVHALTAYKGYGPFMSYQIAVDLSYSKKWLGKAPDYNTFNSAGPGTCRGLARVFNGAKSIKVAAAERTPLLLRLLDASRETRYWPWPHTSKDMKKGFAPLSLSNISNMCCETDKYQRLYLGEGEVRSSYPGQLSFNDSQPSLF